MAERVRISKVGGRYLIYEVKDVATLRRDHCICAVFVGTTPQNPNQNVFSGLPLELLAEEAALLVDKGAAFVVDDAAAHLAQLAAVEPAVRQAYLQSLKTRRRLFQKVADEELGEKRKVGEAKRLKSLAKKTQAGQAAAQGKKQLGVAERDATDSGSLANDEDSAIDVSLSAPEPQQKKKNAQPARLTSLLQHITPTTSVDMIAGPTAHTVPIERPRGYPLYKHLNSKSYYITPGIRFGADYSVYPGDPFRYHAHFMATSYAWDEEISVLDLVTGGRLGTGVKKGFMIGGSPPKEPEQEEKGESVRAFTIEWAAM